MMTNSAIYCGTIAHERFGSPAHRFSYPTFMFALRLEELEKTEGIPLLFGHNRRGVFSIRDVDYLGSSKDSLLRKIVGRLEDFGIVEAPHSVVLITMPALFGYVFNPVSFYLCLREDGIAYAIVIEVNNTFGETHLYPLVPVEEKPPPVSFVFDKKFFVSPFFDVTGEYAVTVQALDNELAIEIDLIQDGIIKFHASLTGRRQPFSARSLLWTLCTFPVTAFLTMARIQKEAAHLHFGKGTSIYERPVPTDPLTIYSKQNSVHRARLYVLSALRSLRGTTSQSKSE